jgi:adenylosuccinate lyase
MNKLEVNAARINEDLESAWEVLAEPIQSVMRRYGLPEPYEQLKALTRGQGITPESIRGFVGGLSLPPSVSKSLLAMTPMRYLGTAEALCRRELENR